MGTLTEVPLQLNYRTGRDDLVRDFFVPCLEAAVMYRRAAGYFTSAGLSLAARGIASLAARRGRMRLVVSPHLDTADVEVLVRNQRDPKRALHAIASRSLADIEDALINDRLNALAWLLAAGLLEIRLALKLDSHGGFARGIYHEKLGIFSDDQDHHVSFSGSSNETAGGLVENFESIKVFRSWQDPEGRVQGDIDDFEAMWSDCTPGLRVLEFTDESKQLLERYRDPSRRPQGLESVPEPSIEPGRSRLILPRWLTVRSYQADAINAWARAQGRGILAMATGSGKTLTALTLATKVAERNVPFALVVICPFVNLCKQWVREINEFGVSPVEAFSGRDKWLTSLELAYQRLQLGLDDALAVVTTNATFMSESFQSLARSKFENPSVTHLLVADEVHNLGAMRIKSLMPSEINLRLGLSATPERHHDPAGTSALLSYFGDVVYEYSLGRAIREGRLCQYRYEPVLVPLTEQESEVYAELSAKIGKALAGRGDADEVSTSAMGLLIKRARLIASAGNKIEALDTLIRSLPAAPSKAIFYCGDGHVADSGTEDEVRQVHAVARLLGERHGLRVRTFTYRESAEERERILEQLAHGDLDGVVAIRCLDEGIDLPDLRQAFLLASSTNPRQFIQRRGRILRRADGKDRAEIFDFIVTPPDPVESADAATFNVERSLFRRELSRIIEFAGNASNGPKALAALLDLRKRYNLLGEPAIVRTNSPISDESA